MDIEWRDIEGFGEKYEISNNGKVRIKKATSRGTLKVGQTVKPFKHKTGYFYIGLSYDKKRKFYLVHRLVAKYFIGDCPQGKEINHIDGNKENNHISNLEYCTRSENIKHMFDKLGYKSGGYGKEHYYLMKFFCPKQVNDLKNKGFSNRSIARQVGVGRACINKYFNGTHFYHKKHYENSEANHSCDYCKG